MYINPFCGPYDDSSKKLNASIFFLDKDKFFGNRTSQNFDALAQGTSENIYIKLCI